MMVGVVSFSVCKILVAASTFMKAGCILKVSFVSPMCLFKRLCIWVVNEDVRDTNVGKVLSSAHRAAQSWSHSIFSILSIACVSAGAI